MLAVGSVTGKPGADGGGHRLFNQEDPAGTGALGAFQHRPLLNGGNARWGSR